MGYFDELSGLFSKIVATNGGGTIVPLDKEILSLADFVHDGNEAGRKTMIIGNGGSASIASHIAIDLLKNCGCSALAFNDSSLLTCISNDLGYEHVFEKPVDVLAKKGDILFAISSSGKSLNILNAAKRAKEKGCFLATFSGFEKDNPLRKSGDINFYVPSASYGYVEIIHLAICHIVVDTLILRSARHG